MFAAAFILFYMCRLLYPLTAVGMHQHLYGSLTSVSIFEISYTHCSLYVHCLKKTTLI